MLRDYINDSLFKGSFPDSLKIGNKAPVHKKDEPTDKENYKPVSVLPLLSKISERLIYDRLNEYLEQYLNSLLCGFRKAHSTQHVLFRLLQEWQNDLDKLGFVGTILMDLSKVYDCLPHSLLIAKFEAYGIGKSGLKLLLSYLSNRKQRANVNSSYSDWYDIIRDHKGLFWAHCYSIYLSMTSSFLLKKQIYVILLMAVQYIAVIII